MRCSKCSAALWTPAQFDAGLCDACLTLQGFDPTHMAPDAFLRGLMDLASFSLDAETERDARGKLEVILLGLYPPPAEVHTTTGTGITAAASHFKPPIYFGAPASAYLRSDAEWKRDTFPQETQ